MKYKTLKLRKVKKLIKNIIFNKKLLLFFITTLFLMSCGSKKQTGSHRTIKDNSKVLVKPIKNESKVTVKTPLYIDVSENKTFFDKEALHVIYANKPNLMTAKTDYIKKYAELAIHEMEVYKIPASITLAQGLLESRYGQSRLTKEAKNHFGIKCHNWEGGRIYHDDDAKGECFRKYELHESSYRDHSLFLSHKKRYAKLFTYDLNDYKSWAKGLRAAGYATDKKYPQKLIALIEEYELYYFDNLVLGEEYVFKEELDDHDEKKEDKPIIQQPVPVLIDKSKYYIVKEGETLYGISKKTNTKVAVIKKFNNLASNEISVGQQLQLFETKNTETLNNEIKKQDKYIVKIGDTIYSIAKTNNITVANLKNINNLKSNNISTGQLLIVSEKK
ncbi:MAG: glucosaminidase domain-containing protein [Flavobacteriaceae bacterium]|nr:glucosaminidase domain-containing protein [Flavobacteriaceae bacterium]